MSKIKSPATAPKAGSMTLSSRKKSAPTKFPIDLQTFLPFRFFQMGLRMSDTGSKLSVLIKESEAPIGDREWRVIALLGAYGGLTNGQLANISSLDAATISRAVKTLKGIGFVDTLQSKLDRRRLLIYLTQAGAKYHDQITPKRIETGELIAAGLSSQELKTLLRILDKLDRHLEHLESETDDEWE
ncbi:MAG: MarR family transcriptional regulator [Pseudomonadales bacterium]|nr:MarR family transcriptional regulator [Pseudomonadales bacterium]